jgi:hypothetical protein
LHKWCRPKEKKLDAPAVPEMERDNDLAQEVPYVPLALRYRFTHLLPVLNQKSSVFDASSSQKKKRKRQKNEPKEN